jgi:predicted acyl esterase
MEVVYPAKKGKALFNFKFAEATELSGYMMLRVSVEARPGKAGEIVPVDIELYPSSTFFSAGETLQLIIAADEIISSPPYRKDASFNRGKHVLHFGGKYDSYLLVPKVPSR